MSVLGLCYLDGVDVPVDHARAFSLLTAAASRGASRAMVGLGRMYEHGLATALDLGQAESWYQRAAERNEFLGWVHLARLQQSTGRLEDARRSYEAALEASDNVAECEELSEARNFIRSQR